MAVGYISGFSEGFSSLWIRAVRIDLSAVVVETKALVEDIMAVGETFKAT